MNREQEQASTQLLRAFRRCYRAGLSAAIYDGKVCLWPKSVRVLETENPIEAIVDCGRTFGITGMFLDGGAGV